MKHKITGLLLVAIIMSTSIFATNIDVNINRRVVNTFTQKFGGVKEVTWTATEHYVKASFSQDEQVFFAYFTPTGEFLGVSRNIVSTHLPINLLNELKRDYSTGWITNLFEFASEDGTDYYATIENADQIISIKSIGLSSWMVSKKLKKSEE